MKKYTATVVMTITESEMNMARDDYFGYYAKRVKSDYELIVNDIQNYCYDDGNMHGEFVVTSLEMVDDCNDEENYYMTFDKENGKKEWYKNGKYHRTDGPAIEYSNGTKYWYYNDKRHRTDGPAVEYSDGYKAWFIDGKRHRTDGPAVEDINGYKAWFIDGVKYTETKFNKIMKPKCDGKIVEIDGKKYKLLPVNND